MSFQLKFIFLSLLTVQMLVLTSCDWLAPEPIRIGFVGGLTGRSATVGTAARDGVLLAVAELNRAGGIDGRKVELIVKDIKQDAVLGLDAVNELIAAKVPVIIGPMTSTMALILVPAVNHTETIMVSPTASTWLLGGKDDNFLRLRPQSRVVANRLADYVIGEKGLQRISIIYDASNSVYTEDWKNSFSERIHSKGGKIAGIVAFDSTGDHSFSGLVDEVLKQKPDGLLVLANSLDTARTTQQLMKAGAKLPVFVSEWSMTRDLLRSGGRSVEGISVFHVFNEGSKKLKYLGFKERYQAQFKQDLSFPTVHAYDTAQVVLAGLKEGARTGPDLKKYLLKQEFFDTLQSTIRFDQYGDVGRDLFLTVIKNGEFVVVDE